MFAPRKSFIDDVSSLTHTIAWQRGRFVDAARRERFARRVGWVVVAGSPASAAAGFFLPLEAAWPAGGAAARAGAALAGGGRPAAPLPPLRPAPAASPPPRPAPACA